MKINSESNIKLDLKSIKYNSLLNLKDINKNNSIKILDYISLVKILSANLVILKHTNANYWVYNKYWISTNIMCSFCMCAVPLFSLCIGATLLNFNERYGIKEYLKKRINKVIIPIIGWNIIYYFYRVYIIKNFQKVKFNFINLYQLYFNNQLNGILGSIRRFIFGYMIIPLFAFINKSCKIQIYKYALIILIINNSTIPYLITIFHQYSYLLNKTKKNAYISWPYNYNSGYIIYLFAGYIIQNSKLNKIFKLFLYIFGIFGLFLRFIISHYLTINNKNPDKSQINYLNLPIVIYSCSVFLFIKEKSKYFFQILKAKYINKIGSLTMGPFFLHYMIIWTLPHFFRYNKYGFNYRFFGFFMISFLCFILTALIRKIPIIKNLIP